MRIRAELGTYMQNSRQMMYTLETMRSFHDAQFISSGLQQHALGDIKVRQKGKRLPLLILVWSRLSLRVLRFLDCPGL